MENRLVALSAMLIEKADALAEAREELSELEDQRPVLKEMAIIRLMKRNGISSNAAKDIVKTDVEYMEHCVERRLAGVTVCRAEAEYEVAKARVTQASLITPSTVELQQMADELLAKNQENARTITDLETKLKMSKRQTDLGEIALRRANKFLSHRIDDVDHLSESVLKLTEENKKLREGILVSPTEVVPVGAWATLDESRESLIAEPYSAEGV